MFATDSQIGFACDLDIVTLFCADNKTIDISSAYYGVYAEACPSDCCAAAAADCTEDVETTAPLDWQDLVNICQNQTFCQFEHPGRSLGSCEPVLSDYIIVSYACLPGMTHMLCMYWFLKTTARRLIGKITNRAF